VTINAQRHLSAIGRMIRVVSIKEVLYFQDADENCLIFD